MRAAVPTLGFTCLLLLAGLAVSATSHAQAAVTADRKTSEAVVGPADRPAGRAPDTTPGSPAAAAAVVADGGPLLRCWQYGRLILEEPVNGATASIVAPGTALQFRGRGDARGVQLLDLRNATCVIR